MTPSSPRELLHSLAGRGISLHADAGTLCVTEADPGTVTPADLETLRDRKPELLSYLERFDLATADAAAVLEAIRRRITWADHLHLADGRDARPPMLAVLEEYARLIEQARERFDADRLEEVVEAATAFAGRWGITLPSKEAAA